MAFYESTNQVEILRERLKELSRIRNGFATHLGSSLYEATKDDEALRWGRESLYDGIAMCDEERKRVLEAIAAIELGLPLEPPAAEPEAAFEPPVVEEPEAAEGYAEELEVDAFVEDAKPEVEVEYELAPEVEPELASGEEGKPFSLDFDEEPAEQVEPAPEPEPVYAPAPEPDASNVCPNCGSEVGPGDRFCMECGAPLVQAAPAPAPKPNVCPNCGSPTEPSFKFCMVCGQKL